MSTKSIKDPRGYDRREFLKLGGGGALLSLWAAGRVARLASGLGVASGLIAAPRPAVAALSPVKLLLAATDGFINAPGPVSATYRGPSGKPLAADHPVYIFGFVGVPMTPPFVDGNGNPVISQIVNTYKYKARFATPLIFMDQEQDVYITLVTLGFSVRPDLQDSHSIHWHGFRNQIALFDGVPEASIAVPALRSFTFFYRPHDPGTYMYHCHFEDVEHVQMGMTGSIFVRPKQNGTSLGGFTKFCFNDGDGSTGYHREYALLLNDMDVNPHDVDALIQEFPWTEYNPHYFFMNGRSYPDTLLPHRDASLPSQPLSSLIQCNSGDRVLLRLANLGYAQHAIQLPGIPLKVVGEDATILRGPGGADLSYTTHTVYIGPGESRDVLFTAPSPGTYLLRAHNAAALTSGGTVPAGEPVGGMATEVRVSASGIGPQTNPNDLPSAIPGGESTYDPNALWPGWPPAWPF